MRTRFTKTTLLAFLALLSPACGGGRDQAADAGAPHDGGADELDLEGCEHLTEGPFVDVTAGATAATAGAVAADHHAYRVALTPGVPGFVAYAATGGEHVLFFDANVALEVRDDQGATVAIAVSVTSVAACTVIAARHTVPLPAVGTYYLRLGPDAAVTAVTIVIEAVGHDHG